MWGFHVWLHPLAVRLLSVSFVDVDTFSLEAGEAPAGDLAVAEPCRKQADISKDSWESVNQRFICFSAR